MDANMSLEEKCERLMNVVVETRKRFGEMCVDYQNKSTLMENKMLNLQVETIANCKIKSKIQIPDLSYDDTIKDMDDFKHELVIREKRIEDLIKKIRSTEKVVVQVKSDTIRQKLEKPISAKAILATVKTRNDNV
ncbi:uncharacterized protein LOC123702334 [Colias croceus]|uniref:uncharacterized protein LOC123702334 n=1 Tax=Colias crocea TaxID=72248 RepID=UPI001E27B32E|nr:uncharacterized protein LOC123702334 [Colias croceus]